MGNFSLAFVVVSSFLVTCFSQQNSTTCPPPYDTDGGAGLEDDVDHENSCRRRNGSEVCEGRGKCECGRCVCDLITLQVPPERRYTGSFCECNDYSCDYSEYGPCGGPTRGRCVCGKCQCTADYRGDACECPTSNKACVASNGIICNAKGKCVCGACYCTAGSYSGPLCEDCPMCGMCESLDDNQCQSVEPEDRCYYACSAKKKKNDADSDGGRDLTTKPSSSASRRLAASVSASILVVLCASVTAKL